MTLKLPANLQASGTVVAWPTLRRLAWAAGLLVGGILLSVVLDIFSAPGDGRTAYGLARRLITLPFALAAVAAALDFVTVTRDGVGFWTLPWPDLVAFPEITAVETPPGERALVLRLEGGRERRLNLAGRVNGQEAAAAIARGARAARPG
ncbi:MAG TPA: hypothetical protein VHN99_02650 [Deinococcales bacterium]|nr:hypothetical protein [Deinococcales bacterium]